MVGPKVTPIIEVPAGQANVATLVLGEVRNVVRLEELLLVRDRQALSAVKLPIPCPVRVGCINSKTDRLRVGNRARIARHRNRRRRERDDDALCVRIEVHGIRRAHYR